jgi:hypothetical protein
MSTHLAACALAVSLAAASLSIGEQRKYVTVDPSGDLDVAFPERLGLPDVHIGLPNQNVPEVHVSVAAQQAGLVFDYALENGEAARQPIISWYLVLPAPDLVNRVEDPQLWKSLRVIPTPADRRALYYAQPPGFFLKVVSQRGIKPRNLACRSKTAPQSARFANGPADSGPPLPRDYILPNVLLHAILFGPDVVELLGVGEPVALTDLAIPLQHELTDVVAIRGGIVRAQEGKALPLRFQARA